MTIPTWAVALVLTPIIGLLAYFVRMTTFDAIEQLRKSADKQGRRIGRLEKVAGVLLVREEDARNPRARRNTLLELKSELDRDDDDDSK